MPTPYTAEFFQSVRASASTSAAVLVPLLAELLRPRSVVDVGCGDGQWLAAWMRAGVEDVQGIDGDYVDRSNLAIPADRFASHDLDTAIVPGRSFDLATSFEVAEHLRPESAQQFVHSLTKFAPVVVFSAAAPKQGGTDHLNEQWPAYWAEHFRTAGFHWIDGLRQRIWNDRRIAWWYRQNIIIFAAPDHVDRIRASIDVLPQPELPLALPHPESYLHKDYLVDAERVQWARYVPLRNGVRMLKSLIKG